MNLIELLAILFDGEGVLLFVFGFPVEGLGFFDVLPHIVEYFAVHLDIVVLIAPSIQHYTSLLPDLKWIRKVFESPEKNGMGSVQKLNLLFDFEYFGSIE